MRGQHAQEHLHGLHARRRRHGMLAAAAAVFLVLASVVGVTLFLSRDDGGKEIENLPPQSLPELAVARHVQIGVGANQQRLRDPSYVNLVGDNFTSITAQSGFKWNVVEPGPGQYDWTVPDRVMAVADEFGLRVRGHTLIWHNQNPAWLTDRDWTREDLLQVMHQHIATVVRRYKGRVAQWDVVNEAFDALTGQRRQSIWQRVIGPDYIELAFRWAHEADPDAELYYNDFGIEVPGTHFQAVRSLVADLRAKGVPIDGVGLQMHRGLDRPTVQDTHAVMNQFTALGVDVELTELDVGIPLPATADALTRQGRVYAAMTNLCLTTPRCTGVTVWGADDRDSYLALRNQHLGAQTLFDASNREKPAYAGVVLALAYSQASPNRPGPLRRSP